jgi:type II secretory pathway pseudopilin PulG
MKMQRPDCHRAHRDENESVHDQFGGRGKKFSVNEKQPCKSRVKSKGFHLCLKNSVFSVPSVAKGFTLIEIVVALGLLIIVILFTGSIFKASIGSYRTAMAQAEIMQKLRVISQQLDSDFRGLRKDAPMFIWFQLDPNNDRFDQIMFFADGDFQATQVPLVGNVARINYGQALSIDPRDKVLKYPEGLRSYDRLLARRQHVSVFNPTPLFPTLVTGLLIDPVLNNIYEYDNISLSQWQAALQNSINCDTVITNCFVTNCPYINTADANTLHNLMTEGVGSFSVQWSYYYPHQIPPLTGPIITDYLWWPSDDPYGDGGTSASDFNSMGNTYPSYISNKTFGFYFNVAAPSSTIWFSSDKAVGVYYPGSINSLLSDKPAYPQALKFTFAIYDSRGVFRDGQTFTHIVYLGD